MAPTDELATAGRDRLKAADKRITPQRRLILDILATARGHLDAAEIHEQGRRRDPRLSLSTVYRTLAALKETGAVRELHLDEEHHHYELAMDDQHSHLVCTGCGRVVELDSGPFEEVARRAAKAHGFELAGAQVELSGLCAVCRRTERAPDLVPLGTLATGEAGCVRAMDGGQALRGRLVSLGFTPGARLKMVQNSRRGPLIVEVRDTRVALGRGEAVQIVVERV